MTRNVSEELPAQLIPFNRCHNSKLRSWSWYWNVFNCYLQRCKIKIYCLSLPFITTLPFFSPSWTLTYCQNKFFSNSKLPKSITFTFERFINSKLKSFILFVCVLQNKILFQRLRHLTFNFLSAKEDEQNFLSVISGRKSVLGNEKERLLLL